AWLEKRQQPDEPVDAAATSYVVAKPVAPRKLYHRLSASDLYRAYGGPGCQERAAPGRGDAQDKQQNRQDRGHRTGNRYIGGDRRSAMRHDDSGGERPRRSQLEPQRAVHTFASARVPLVPPKPNELESASRMGIFRAALGT